MPAPENYALYYPEEPEVGTPTLQFVPTKCLMLGGTGNGRDRGLLQQQTADGERTSYVIHAVRRHFVRPLWGVSYAEMILHDTFFDATRGFALRYTDRFIYPVYVTVKAIGESIEGEWTPVSPTTWAHVDEFEESQAVPTLSDAGQVRAGTDAFADLEIEKTFAFDTPYADDGFYLTVSEHVASDGNTYDLDVVGKTATGFTLRIKGGMSPGMGETLGFDYIAVHN